MKRLIAVFALAILTLLATTMPAQAAVQIETFTSPAAFKARLAGAACPAKTVNFDDIRATTRMNAVRFSATKYKMAFGVIVKGEGGQYASRGFGSAADFVPVSKPNMYAPGPIAWSGPDWTGGNETDVTFWAGDRIAAAGFGCYFIDADWPGDGPASFAVYDAKGAELGATGTIVTANAKNAFVGLVAVDSATNSPIRVISRVHVVNGSGWLGNDNNEGVALDNFIAGTATYRVAGKVVRRSGTAFRGVMITLKGSFTRRVTTGAAGRYTITNIPPGTYSIMPTKKGSTFKPAKRTITVVAANVTVARFRQR